MDPTIPEIAGATAAWASVALAVEARKRRRTGRGPAAEPAVGITGDANTVVNDPRPVSGNRNTIVGPTDANGNTILNSPGSIAIGASAYAGPGSISIGAGAGAGMRPAASIKVVGSWASAVAMFLVLLAATLFGAAVALLS